MKVGSCVFLLSWVVYQTDCSFVSPLLRCAKDETSLIFRNTNTCFRLQTHPTGLVEREQRHEACRRVAPACCQHNGPGISGFIRVPFGSTFESGTVALYAKKSKQGSTEKGTTRRRDREIREELEKLIAESGCGIDGSDEYLKEVDRRLQELEECNTVENPTRSSKLWGYWQLIFTNSVPDLRQNLFSNGTAETIEFLKIPPFGNIVSSSLRGPLTAATSQVLELKYVDVQLASFFQSKANDVGSEVFFSKAVLAITYLSDDLRVCRSPSGAAFLFRRVGLQQS